MKLMDWMETIFAEYGYLVLLIGLPLDAIALPIPPGNTTLAYTGYLCYKGVLSLLPALGAAYIGAVTGMTITYWIGRRVGAPLVERYGRWLLLKPAQLQKTREAYARYGNRLLFFSYFMPGVRQFIGYFTGIAGIPFRTFALYAYPGAALWVGAFASVGYVFGDEWQTVFLQAERSLKTILLVLLAALVVYLLFKWAVRAKTRRDKPGDNQTDSEGLR